MTKDPPKFNSLCMKCCGKCKQKESVFLLMCPRFEPIPVQLEIKVPGLNMPFARRA
jgi:hypothetical protein